MKRSSLQWKLTLWFSAALVLMAVLTFIVVFFVSHSVLQKQLRTELIHTVEDNVDEVEFYRSIAQMDQDGDTDHWPRYETGKRLTRLITSTRDVMSSDPDEQRRSAWAAVY